MGGFLRRHALSEIAFDVLDHDDRVIDDDTDGQHQSEQRQRIERDADGTHHEKRTDQRDGYSDDRNDRRAPCLQKHDHHDHDEQNRLDQRLNDRVDRVLNEFRRIVDDRVPDTRGKICAQFFHLGLHRVGGRQRVRAGLLKQDERGRRLVVEVGVDGVIL